MAPKLVPHLNIGPGQIIQRNMQALNWSNKDLAEVLGMSEKSVSLMINDKQGITVDSAALLGRAFGSSPEFWLNLDQAYRMRQKKEGKRERDTATRAEIRKYLPLAEMRKKGWISCSRTAESQAKAAAAFLGTDSPDFSEYRHESLPFCARRGKPEADEDITRYYSLTWFRKAKTEAESMRARRYASERAVELAASLIESSRDERGPQAFIEKLGAAGIKFFVLSHLSKTYLDGASFRSGANPVIVYTARYDRLDNFWWTVGHELAHVILHLKEGDACFLDDLDDREHISKQEKEADEYASKLFGVKKLLAAAEPYRDYFSESRLLAISGDLGLSPSLALGILQHHGYVDYRSLTRYRQKATDQIEPSLIRG